MERLKGWHWTRWVRLIAGSGMLVYGAMISDWPLFIVGLMLGWMAIANTGCSPFSNSCEIEPKASKKNGSVLEDHT